MRVDSREPIPCASVGVIFLPRKPATRGASAASTACREMASYSGTEMSSVRNIKSVEYSAHMQQPWLVAARGQHVRHEVFLVDVALVDVFDLRVGGFVHLLRTLANTLAHGLGA